LVVCSLEPRGEVRRGVRILVDEIVDLDPSLPVLYVAPAVDIRHQLKQGKVADITGSRLHKVHARIHVLRPHRWLPRSVGPSGDRHLERQTLDAIGEIGLRKPLLWVNDPTPAPFAVRTGWPSLYKVTHDRLLAPLSPCRRSRLRADNHLLMERSHALVVCSTVLARSRGRSRTLELMPNGVAVDLFGTSRSEPSDLPVARITLDVATLCAERMDAPLVLSPASARPDLRIVLIVLIVLIGSNTMPEDMTSALSRVPTIHLFGPRPYDQIPADLQRGDVVVIHHLVNSFTESLDPINAHECLAAGQPTIDTPVAGPCRLGPPIVIVDRECFVEAMSAALATATPAGLPATFDDTPVPAWRGPGGNYGVVDDSGTSPGASVTLLIAHAGRRTRDLAVASLLAITKVQPPSARRSYCRGQTSWPPKASLR
jgi:teichuronic acid biosynthesis glycosyltransferase TuaH